MRAQLVDVRDDVQFSQDLRLPAWEDLPIPTSTKVHLPGLVWALPLSCFMWAGVGVVLNQIL